LGENLRKPQGQIFLTHTVHVASWQMADSCISDEKLISFVA